MAMLMTIQHIVIQQIGLQQIGLQQIGLQNIAPVTATCIGAIALLLIGLLLFLSKLLAARLAHIVQDIQPLSPPQQVRLRQQLLHAVHREIRQSMAQAQIPNPVHPAENSDSAQNSQLLWNSELQVGQKEVKLTTTLHLLKAFQQPQMARRVLILGASGAGKTTLLMNLADACIARSPADLAQPLPVLLNLSSWTKDYLSFEQWLLIELKTKYGLRLDVGKTWLETHQLLPFLDGLDQLDRQLQGNCLQAINQFQQTFQPPGLVVCGQPEAYQRCAVPLNVVGTIWLYPLAIEQVQTHLEAISQAHTWQAIQKNPPLLRLARSPLMLHFLPQLDLAQISHSDDVLRLYIKKKIGTRPSSNSPHAPVPQPSPTLHWLSWLAQSLQKRGQSEFLIERMQPSWLPNRGQRVLHRLGVVLMAAGLVAAIAALTDSISTLGITSPVFWGVIAAAIAAFPSQSNLLETLSWSRYQARRGLVIGLLRGAIGSLCLGIFLFAICSAIFLVDPIYLKTIRETLISGSFLGLIIIFSAGSMGALLTGLWGVAIERRSFPNQASNQASDQAPNQAPNQGIWRSAKNTLIFALIGFVVGSLVTGIFTSVIDLFFDMVGSIVPIPLKFRILYYPPVMLKTGLMIGVISGLTAGIACLQHFVLRVMLWYNGSIPWNYARFLNHVTQRSLMQQIGGRYRFTHDLLRDYLAQSHSPAARPASKFSQMPVIGSNIGSKNI